MVQVEIKIKAFDDIASFAFKASEEKKYDVLEYFAELVLKMPDILGNRVTWNRLDQAVETFNQILDISREIKVMNGSDPDLDVTVMPSLPVQGRNARRNKTHQSLREKQLHQQHDNHQYHETPCLGQRSQTTPLDDAKKVKGSRASSPSSQGSNISGSTNEGGFRRLSKLISSQAMEFPSLSYSFRAFSNQDGDHYQASSQSQDSILPNEAARQKALRLKDEQKPPSPVSQLPLPPKAPRAHSDGMPLPRRPHWLSSLGVK